MKTDEQTILNKIAAARDDYKNQRFTQAIEKYRELVELLQDDRVNLPILQIELGWSYYQNLEFQKAIDQFQQALESEYLTPEQEFDCFRLIGFSYEVLQQNNQAIQYLEQALSLNVPEDLKKYSYFELGKLYFHKGSLLESEHYLQEARRLIPPEETNYHLSIDYFLGFIRYFQKKFEEARELFNHIIGATEEPKAQATGYFGLAHLFYQEKNYVALIDTCEKILRLDDKFYDKEALGYFMCYGYLYLQKWDELELFLQELEKNYPQGRFAVEYPKFREALRIRKIPEQKGQSDELARN